MSTIEQKEPKPEPGAIRVCPERDGRCPHGMDCPFTIDRYTCDIASSRAALSSKEERK